MKGAKLNILILTIIGLVCAFIMVLLNLAPSWSQYARSLEEPLLFATLSSFSSVFIIRSFTHGMMGELLTKIGKIRYRQEHNDRITGYLFIGILLTPVTHPNEIIETAHFVFTGLAILFAYYGLATYYKQGTLKYYGIVWGLMTGLLGFFGGFLLHLYSVGVAEIIASLPIAIHVIATLNHGKIDINLKKR